jgi:hypothetical protein
VDESIELPRRSVTHERLGISSDFGIAAKYVGQER